MKRGHDIYLRRFWQHLLAQGKRVAMEVGIPGGRVDLVLLDEEDAWVEICEVKTSLAHHAFAQLHRYARVIDRGAIRKTLVVPPCLATDALRDEAKLSRVHLEVFDGSFQAALWERPQSYVQLPFLAKAAA